jgi:ribosome maturation factor RimP
MQFSEKYLTQDRSVSRFWSETLNSEKKQFIRFVRKWKGRISEKEKDKSVPLEVKQEKKKLKVAGGQC